MTVIGYQQSEVNPNGIDFNKDGLYFKWNSDSTGAMQTIQCNSIDEFYQLQKDNDAHFFQVVRADKPVREYYDIDYILQEDEKISDHEFVSDFVAKRYKLITLLNIPGKYFLYPNDLIVLTAHSDKKLSFHIYSKKSGFKNTETHKQFSDLLKKYIEVSLTTSVMCGVLPSNDGLEFSDTIVKIDNNMSDEEIINTIKEALKDQNKLNEMSKKATELAMLSYTYRQGVHVMNDIYKRNFLE